MNARAAQHTTSSIYIQTKTVPLYDLLKRLPWRDKVVATFRQNIILAMCIS